MDPGFVTISNPNKRRARRGRKNNKSINRDEHKKAITHQSNQKDGNMKAKAHKPTISNNIAWEEQTTCINTWQCAQCTFVNSMTDYCFVCNAFCANKSITYTSIQQIQNEQEFEQVLAKQKQLFFNSFTDNDFLLSLTLSKLQQQPSLIICASYILRVCQKLNLYFPSSLIILCHKYFQYYHYSQYLLHSPKTTNQYILHFISQNKQINIPSNPKMSQNIPVAHNSIVVARNISLKYPELIPMIDTNNNFAKSNGDIQAIFEWTSCSEIKSSITTWITLFDENGIYCYDGGETLKSIVCGKYNNYKPDIELSAIYGNEYGLCVQISEMDGNHENIYYHLVRNDEIYCWENIENVYKLSTKSLMSTFNANIFIYNEKQVCFYTFENDAWTKLQCPDRLIDKHNPHQLYFDSNGQKMFCLFTNEHIYNSYKFDIIHNKWITCCGELVFNYFNVFKNKWYRHSIIDIQNTGGEKSFVWIEKENPNILYCGLSNIIRTYRRRRIYRTLPDEYYIPNVKYYDNRSSKQWILDMDRTHMFQNIRSFEERDKIKLG